MKKKYLQLDEKLTGKITIADFKAAMSCCALLTPKEVNVIIRGIKPEQTHFEYKHFETILFEVRFELAKSRLMDTGIDKLTAHLIEEFSRIDAKKSGSISITDIKKVLFNSKYTNLTPF
jgi:Ca2+-binding EF-hand superfamily protein